MGEYKHYAVYEHRNCDNLVVLINEGFSMNTPSVEFMWEGHDGNGKLQKWGYDKDFDFGEIPSTVSKWCQNTIQPDIKTLNEIANLLDMDVKDLLVSNK